MKIGIDKFSTSWKDIKKTKPNAIGLDLDGVVADSVGLGAKYLQNYLDKDPLIGSDDYEEMFGVSYDEVIQFFNIFAQRIWKESLPVRGSILSLRKLHEVFPITILTKRPEKDRKITLEWLKSFSIPYDEIYFIGGKGTAKGDHPAIKNCFCFIDDEIRNAVSIADKKIPVFLFRKDYDHPRVICVNGWKEIEEYILLKKNKRLIK